MARNVSRFPFAILAALAALLAASLPAAALPASTPANDYFIYRMGYSSALVEVNNHGVAVGCDTSSSPYTAFMWQLGKRTDLAPGCATRINDTGVIVIQAPDNTLATWKDGVITPLGVKGYAMKLTEDGRVVGFTFDTAGVPHGFLYADGKVTLLPEGESTSGSYAEDINAAGQIVIATSANGYALLQGVGGPLTELRQPNSGIPFTPYAIDRDGVIYGFTAYETGFYSWRDGATTFLYPGRGGHAGRVNDFGLAVGAFEDDDWNDGFVVGGGKSVFLNWLPVFQAHGWSYVSPGHVNNAGWITGSAGHNYRGPFEGFLMIPRDDPLLGVPALSMQRAADFDADRRADLLWQHAMPLSFDSSQTAGVWLMEGLGAKAYGTVPGARTMLPLAKRDFDGDGRIDVLYRDVDEGYHVALMNGTSSTVYDVQPGGQFASFVGSGDFDGDGKADLLWHLADGTYVARLMAGGSVRAEWNPVAAPTNAHPAVVADFNGDGRDDVLWQGDDGHFQLFVSTGSGFIDAGQVRAAGTGFVPLTLGDFNGDGSVDIVWRHPDGRQSLWLMNGATPVNSTSLTEAGNPWHVTFAADLDGDGKSDLLWAHDDGSQAGWLMDGTRARAYGVLLGPGTGWRVAGTADLDGNGTADLVWRRDDGSYGGWLMNGLQPTRYGSFFGPNTGWDLVQ